MEKHATNLQKYFNLPNPGLRAYFVHNEQGNTDDYRPPFWKGQSRAQVLDSWQKVYDTLGIKSRYPTLYDFEMEMKGKVGPMSIQMPLVDRIPSIENYYTMVEHPGEPISELAIQATAEFFRKAKGVRLRSQSATVKDMRLSTNSGTPYFTKRRNVVEKTAPVTITHDGNQVLGNGSTYPVSAVLGWRGQEGGIGDDDVKQRVIWMMSLGLNIVELTAYQPLIQAIQRHKLIPAYVSMDAVDDEVTALWESKAPEQVVVCTDFTAFDQHFNVHMQEAARRVLQYLLTPSAATDEWFANVFPQKYNLPLICSEKLMFTGPHGMGSGSGGTNFDECLAHKALQFEAAQRVGKELNPHSMAYGDDGILTWPGITVEDVTRSYTLHGQDMNVSKQYVSAHDCVVLRRWHSDSFRDSQGRMVGVYSTFRALGRLLAQERYYDPDVWGPEAVTLRAWSIIENCNHNPCFEPFVDFVCSTGDKYKLGLGIPGFLNNVGKIAQKSIDQLPDFLGYTKTMQSGDARDIAKGIREWRIYKYLKSKA
nr:RNA-dependent RNA polymerase [Marmot picobirnavirus]